MMRVLLLGITSILVLAGCASAGDSVSVDAVNAQAEKEKAINKKALEEQNLAPGEGPGS